MHGSRNGAKRNASVLEALNGWIDGDWVPMGLTSHHSISHLLPFLVPIEVKLKEVFLLLCPLHWTFGHGMQCKLDGDAVGLEADAWDACGPLCGSFSLLWRCFLVMDNALIYGMEKNIGQVSYRDLFP
ncbi:hypothetical protein BRADI_1g49945v3 [Brachypodium distachyon]|uniref:Uncharacterized protein n=1 Tax=Brachypodium distachyon TaxID=15368 RepID=A0A2K2DQN5_BRADI|nr:hypothetical protein BRADI_1g49945v3 [Brachypodium distachyon]